MTNDNKKPDWKVTLQSGKTLDLFRCFEQSAKLLNGRLSELEALSTNSDKFVAELLKHIDEKIEKATENFKYFGTFQRAIKYQKNNLVTHGGQLWICLKNTDETPGKSEAWQLCAKNERN